MTIESFEGYEVSDFGRVRSWWASKRDKRVRRSEPVFLTLTHGGKSAPYLKVTISQEGKDYFRRVHSCVLTAFVGPRPVGKWGLHGDGNFRNNRLGNLRWGTPKENADDRAKHGRSMLGSANHKSKLTADQVGELRALYAAGTTSQTAG